mgnify:CR=1 FL=1
METVYERVKGIVVDELGLKDGANVQKDTRFVENLKADSLDLVALIQSLEKEFSTDEYLLEIPDDEAQNIHTVGDAVNWLKAHGVTDAEEVAV